MEVKIIGFTTQPPKYARLLIWDSFVSFLRKRRNPVVSGRQVSSESEAASSPTAPACLRVAPFELSRVKEKSALGQRRGQMCFGPRARTTESPLTSQGSQR